MTTSFHLLWGLFLCHWLYGSHCLPTGHVHIVYLGHSHGQDPLLTTELHVKLLSSVFSRQEEAEEAMVYSYRHGFSGFAVMLDSTQASTLASFQGVM